MSGLFRIFIQNNLLNLLVLQQIPELLYEKEGILKGSENTSRGRSLLFLCAALSVAGILGENVPVYIPENGFIGLNIPLTGGRKGTCSTRTTHPYF